MGIDAIGLESGSTVGAPRARGGGETFTKAITEFLEEVNRDQIGAATRIKALTVDGQGSIHDAMIAMTKAEGSLRLLMEMRNRLVDGINRLLQTQV